MIKLGKNILNILAFLLIIFHFVSWIFLGAIYKVGKEHPMSDINGFVVTDSGNIILADGFYSVIQVFDKNGKFMTSFYPNERNYELMLGEENTIIVKSSNTRYFSINGKEIKDKEFNVSERNASNLKDYEITGGMFFPEVIKFVDGKEYVIVQQSTIMNITKAPFPFFGSGFLSLLLFGLSQTIKKIRKPEEQV